MLKCAFAVKVTGLSQRRVCAFDNCVLLRIALPIVARSFVLE
jgi:hypothetical protein